MQPELSAAQMSPISPILLERRPIPKIWGGRALERVPGIELPAGQEIGEVWLLYDRPDGSSAVAGGGETLAGLMRRDAAALLGAGVRAGHGGRFPLLLKLIDAREALSLQVHPDDAEARGDGDGGKHEACVVLHAGPAARIVSGLLPDVTREQLLAAAATAGVERLVRSFAPRAGDCVDLPAGTVHSLGPDVVVFEVEQNSDVTYRIHDWGRSRALQVDRAGAVARTGSAAAVAPRPPRRLDDGGLLLTENPWFRVRRYALDAGRALATDDRFLTLTVVGGRGTVGWRAKGECEPLRVRAGDTVLVPACAGEVFLSPLGGLDVIVCDPGAAA